MVRYQAASTRAKYEQAVYTWAQWLSALGVPLEEARRSHLDRWLSEMAEAGLSPATRAWRLAAVSRFYEVALDEGWMPVNPAARIRRPRLSRDSQQLGLEPDEVARLIQAAARQGPEELGLVYLLRYNGLRISEALAIRPEDFEIVSGHRVVNLRRKGGIRARAPVNPRTWSVLSRLARGVGSPLFRWDIFQAERLVRRLAREAGIPKRVTPHTLRHAFVTSALAAGVPLHVVQDAAGHADPRTTQRYNRARYALDTHPAYTLEAAFPAEKALPALPALLG